MKLADIRFFPYTIPFKVPFSTAAGTIWNRSGWIIQLEDREGRVGPGEWAPLPGWSPDAAEVNPDQLEAVAARLKQADQDLESALTQIMGDLHAKPALCFALETAVTDLAAQAAGYPLYRYIRSDASPTVLINAIVPAGPLDQVMDAAVRRYDEGYRTLKLKIRGPEDEALLSALRERLGTEFSIRLDANGAWDVPTAIKILRKFEAYDIEYVEQPTDPLDYDALGRVRAEVSIPVAADELVTDRSSVKRMVEDGSVDVVVLKPMIQGGIRACLDMARLAEAGNVKVVLTTTLDAIIGRTATAHLAAACSTPGMANGLATGSFLQADLAKDPLRIKNGTITLAAVPGLGLSRIAAQ